MLGRLKKRLDNIIKNKSEYSLAPEPITFAILTLTDLEQASTENDKLNLLNDEYDEHSGWLLGHTLVKSERWNDVNKYLDILKTLPEDKRSLREHRDSLDKTFGELITISNMDASVLFNILHNFVIDEKEIKNLGRRPGLKERVKQYIEALEIPFDEKQAIWKKCVDINTPLGKFFGRTRTQLGYSKFETDYAKTNIVCAIESLIIDATPRSTTSLLSNSRSNSFSMTSQNRSSFFRPSELNNTDVNNPNKLTLRLWFYVIGLVTFAGLQTAYRLYVAGLFDYKPHERGGETSPQDFMQPGL